MELTRNKFIIAIAVLAGFLLLSYLIASNKPQGKFRPQGTQIELAVEAYTVQSQSYQFQLDSFGNVQPRTQSLLVAQVSGQIVNINPAFRDGGFFKAGDVLINIDDRDYLASVNMAKAELMQAKLSLAEEKARANQALIDWQRLGNGEQATDLVLRKPQLAVAEAQILSAEANYEKAKLDLQRTKITAPYNGRVKTKNVDIGQFVNSNAQLATIFATDVLEVRLPLKNSDLPFITLPENFQDAQSRPEHYPNVIIGSDLGSYQEWRGKIVRTEAAIDDDSHQLYVVAQIDKPFVKDDKHVSPLKIGQYVTATIEGSKLSDVLIIPNGSIYQGSYVYTVRDDVLQRQPVTIGFQNDSVAFIESGLNAGDRLVTSPLGQVTSGTRVTIKNTEQQARAGAEQP
ncbi:MAG: efflux RND transporter periplasmic adaptor subunit [Candidatus Pelagadaptatus aseana]|uniref:efflux RND transporter periplasmic adaptor subunit n=1 Tax=Candidatus Pelagadaptatus aseana TaxID=3120508 RepID=UPI0039B19C5F